MLNMQWRQLFLECAAHFEPPEGQCTSPCNIVAQVSASFPIAKNDRPVLPTRLVRSTLTLAGPQTQCFLEEVAEPKEYALPQLAVQLSSCKKIAILCSIDAGLDSSKA